MSDLTSFVDVIHADNASCSDNDSVLHIQDRLLSGGPHSPADADELLRLVDEKRVRISQVLALLTCTQHVRQFMRERDPFIQRVASHWAAAGMELRRIDRLLNGFRGTEAMVAHLEFPLGVKHE